MRSRFRDALGLVIGIGFAFSALLLIEYRESFAPRLEMLSARLPQLSAHLAQLPQTLFRS